jgi:hypothetical protein
LGIAAVVFGATRLSEIYRPGTVPNGSGRIALFTFYALAGSVSFTFGTKLLRSGLRRNEHSPEIHATSSEAISVKERVSMVLPGAFLTWEGVRLLIGAFLIVRG